MTGMRYFIFLTILFLLFSSCSESLLVQSTGVLQNASKTYHLKNGNREIIYIPMRHLGKRNYYDFIQRKVDSLQKEGFVVFYESIAYEVDSVQQRDVYDRKFRKLVGHVVGSTKVYEKTSDTTKVLMAPIYKNLGSRIIQQPEYSFFKVDYNTAVVADIPKNVLLDEYEYTHGPIVLDDCDWNTPLNKPYTCKPIKTKWKNIFNKDFIMKRREENLAALVADASQQKILIMFGGAHYKGFLKCLQERNHAWKIIK
ncbi:hypothetical protein LZQ00_09470 [Sphingobacterium sp. SRCM116780]|uniref:hypothetical protein n=1 Tax=Sphingobacterium sp. SRCM116780 TaxID=2907623 RepID=UPI001F47F3A8|nr:hypothetical protein [Sphingobacterium sp. SRCM116780]UIR54500.1 hypothetical protein LZQ00_09470 [Sphingobacterium sp. SRCM116780]